MKSLRIRLRSTVRMAASILTVMLFGALVLTPTQATTVTEYLIPGNPGLWDLSVNGTSTNGGVVVFTESASNHVGYLFLSNNTIRRIPIPTMNSFPMGIVHVPWANETHRIIAVFTESYGNKIGVMTNRDTRRIIEYTVPTPGSGLRKVIYDPVRKVIWFTEYAAGKLGNLSFSTTRFGELPLPGAGLDSNPIGIAMGANLTAPQAGKPYVWVADFGRKSIVRVLPESGECKSYYVGPFSPWDVAVDADGVVWFTAQKVGTDVNVIGRLDPVAYEQNKWALTLFSIPTPNCEVHDIEIDARGNIWFTEHSGYVGKIGRYSPLTNTFSEYQIATPNAKPQGLAIYTEEGGTINVWFTEYGAGRIGRIRQPEGPTVSTTVYSISSAVTTSSTATTTFYGTQPRSVGTPFVFTSVAAAVTNTSATTTSSTIFDTMSIVVTSSTYWTLTYTYTTSTSYTTTTTTYTVTVVSAETTSTTTTTTFTEVSTSWQSVTTLTTATVWYTSWFSETTSTTTTSTQVSTTFSPTVTVPTTTTVMALTTVYSPTVTLTSTTLTETTTTTTSTTTTATTVYSPTVTLTSTTTSFTTFLPVRPCIIASVAYGSELAPEVHLLRTFRDSKASLTVAGSQFMKVFNSFYYSFSPTVASMISSSSAATFMLRALLYPLIGILRLSSSAFDALAPMSEVGIVATGLLTSAMIGLVYIAPVAIGFRCVVSKRGAGRSFARATS